MGFWGRIKPGMMEWWKDGIRKPGKQE